MASITENDSPTQRKRPRVTKDLISRLSTSPNTNSSYDNTLRPQNENKDVELQRLSALILKLEDAYQDAITRKDAIQLKHKLKCSEYDELIERLTSEKAEAEARAIYHHKQSKDAMQALDLIKKDYSDTNERLRKQADTLETEKNKLASDIISEQYQRQKAESALQLKEPEYTNMIQQLETTVQVLQGQVNQQANSIKEGVAREEALNEKWKETEAKYMNLSHAQVDAEAILTFDRQVKLQDDARKMEIENEKLKNELKHYKEMYHNVEMLREEKYSLESRVREMDQIRADNIKLDVENTRLKMEKLEWAGYLEKADGVDVETPQGIIYNLTKEREEGRFAEQQIQQLQSELDQRLVLISALESHITELTKATQDKDRRHRSDILAMELLEKDKLYLKKHVDVLSSQMKLYDIEESNYMEGNYDVQKTQRIQELESLLKELEDRLSMQAKDIIQIQLDETLSSSSPSTIVSDQQQPLSELMTNLSKENQAREENMKKITAELQAVKKSLHIAQEQVALLHHVIERHGMDEKKGQEQTVRILSFKENPAAQEYGIRKQELESLRNENATLLQQLLQSTTLSEAVGSVNNPLQDSMVTVPKISIDNMQQRQHLLEQDLAKREKRIQRLNQVFEKKVDDFIRTIKEVLGYRCLIFDDGRVQLESKYVNSRDLSFLITMPVSKSSTSCSSNDELPTLKVLGRNKDEYLRTLQSVYDTFVEQQHSIPCFLSAATLELHDKQTTTYDMYDPNVNHDDNQHQYIEEQPLLDHQGHELVQPEPMDKEDELENDPMAEADDSGDNDYIEMAPNDEDGYDGDRLNYLGDEEAQNIEDYDPKYQNREIQYQERAGSASPDILSEEEEEEREEEGRDEIMSAYREEYGHEPQDRDREDEEHAIDDYDQGINENEDEDEEEEFGFHHDVDDDDDDGEEEGDDEEDDLDENSEDEEEGNDNIPYQHGHFTGGQENDPISLDDDDDEE